MQQYSNLDLDKGGGDQNNVDKKSFLKSPVYDGNKMYNFQSNLTSTDNKNNNISNSLEDNVINESAKNSKFKNTLKSSTEFNLNMNNTGGNTSNSINVDYNDNPSNDKTGFF